MISQAPEPVTISIVNRVYPCVLGLVQNSSTLHLKTLIRFCVQQISFIGTCLIHSLLAMLFRFSWWVRCEETPKMHLLLEHIPAEVCTAFLCRLLQHQHATKGRKLHQSQRSLSRKSASFWQYDTSRNMSSELYVSCSVSRLHHKRQSSRATCVHRRRQGFGHHNSIIDRLVTAKIGTLTGVDDRDGVFVSGVQGLRVADASYSTNYCNHES